MCLFYISLQKRYKLHFCYILFIISLGCSSSIKIEYSSINSCGNLLRKRENSSKESNWHLVILSNANCGYCYILKLNVQKHRLYDFANITYIEYDLKRGYFDKMEKEGLYTNCEVISGDGCKNYTDFFPILLLYDLKKSKLSYTEKGVDKNTVKNIITHINHH